MDGTPHNHFSSSGSENHSVRRAIAALRLAEQVIQQNLIAHDSAVFVLLHAKGKRLQVQSACLTIEQTAFILRYHRMISSVLEQAVKEQLIPFNPASKATLPKVEKKMPNYFQPQQVDDILTALESEPLKWKALTHLLIASGCRRGEALGLKWAAVDFDNNRVHIENNVVYDPEHGIYEGSTKTETAVRWLNLPAFTMDILKEWKKEQWKHIAAGDYYHNQDFVFAKDDGGTMHPDSVTDWMNKFSKRHGLPHINPHAFRHTQASILASANVSDVTLAGRLGHSNAAFTKKQYAHMFEDADKTSADIIANAFQKRA